jgi:hypothetical protein
MQARWSDCKHLAQGTASSQARRWATSKNVECILGTIAWSSGFRKSCSSGCRKRGLISKHATYEAFIMQQKHRLAANASTMYPLADTGPTRHNALTISQTLEVLGVSLRVTLHCNDTQLSWRLQCTSTVWCAGSASNLTSISKWLCCMWDDFVTVCHAFACSGPHEDWNPSSAVQHIILQLPVRRR